ncbi:MAG TPA: hypothetical protein PLA31_01320, partial [Clostridia bacterium]|nr:hypothetical protein [Clostridia bacterium]
MNRLTLMKMRKLRDFLRDDVRRRTDFTQTDQTLGVEMPPVQKPLAQGERLLPLPEWRGFVHPRGALDELIGNRRSVRKYLDEPLTAAELSFLLWVTQGVRQQTPARVLRNDMRQNLTGLSIADARARAAQRALRRQPPQHGDLPGADPRGCGSGGDGRFFA